MNVYECCPVLEDSRFLLRLVEEGDWADLLKVYSDKAAVPIFNSDNCTGDFYITTQEDMQRMIQFWLMEYGQRYYVRWSILDRAAGAAIGTVELFHRKAEDFFDDVGLLRLDLGSGCENEADIAQLLSLILPASFGWFHCSRIATKAKPIAEARIRALTKLGFQKRSEYLYGYDGRAYGDYYTLDAGE